MPAIIFTLVLIAVLLLWQSGRRRESLGLPRGKVVYADTRKWLPLEEPLYDPVLGLTGRPDYLVERGGNFIPVEVKSSRVYETPFEEHIYQLAAYCLLVHQVYEKRPPYGILHYPDRTFEIEYTADLELGLMDLLAEIRRQERKDEVPRSHESVPRCNKCGFRSSCDQRLK